MNNLLKSVCILSMMFLLLNSCGKQVDAKKYPPDPRERVKRNLEEGKGFRLSSKLKDLGKGGSGNFEFASSNELWRASLDTIDFMPLSSVNYSGGIIITDWYSDNTNSNESIKLTLRFLSNEIASNSIKVIVHKKKCSTNTDCVVKKVDSKITEELIASILTKASEFENQSKKKKK